VTLDTTHLSTGELVLVGRLRAASNATFLATIGGTEVVYKPVAGERPLWDFPDGTLAARELAAYVVSEALGWEIVPPTIVREGPHGVGMVQQWQEPDPDLDAVDLVDPDRIPPGYLHVLDAVDGDDRPVALVHEDTMALRRMAIFDLLVNNADRKAGHVLAMTDGHRFGVDHGVTFHQEPKLRTVLWGWATAPLTADEITAVPSLDLRDSLCPLLTPAEVDAFEARRAALLADPRFPVPSGTWPAIPWPAF
jgi:uncharacterized repeat protein (TIGR03843 family)